MAVSERTWKSAQPSSSLTLFLYGIVLGAVGLFGLSLLLAGMRRSYRRGSAARQGLKESRSETAESRRETAAVSEDRDDLIEQRDTARAYTASDLGNGTPGQRSAAGQANAALPESPARQPAPMSLPVRPPSQMTRQRLASHEHRQEDRAPGRSGQGRRQEDRRPGSEIYPSRSAGRARARRRPRCGPRTW